MIKFIYIPAIKDESIFQNLLRDVYYCVANNSEFSEAIARFTSDVRAGTSDLFSQLDDALGSETSISAPSRLEELFETLDFETKKNGSNFTKSLTLQRGDGIKVRHIPEILKFISRNDGSNYHIWGFEEPENSLDFTSSTSESIRFKEISTSDDVQIFLTTHNPSFYNVSSQNGVSRAYVRGDEGKGATVIQGKSLERLTDEELMDDGFFLPAIARRLAEVQNNYEKLQEEIELVKAHRHTLSEEIIASQKPILIVEGETDKYIIDSMIRKISKEVNFNIISAGGTGNLDIFRKKRDLLSTLFEGKKILILVDADDAGVKAMPQGFDVACDFKMDVSGYWWRTVPISARLQKISESVDSNNPFFCIEDIFGSTLLEGAKKAGELRLKDTFRHGIKTNKKSFHKVIEENPEYENHLLEIDDSCKTKLAQWLVSAQHEKEVLESFSILSSDIQRVIQP